MKNIKLRIVYLILCSALLLFALFMLAVNLIIPAHFVREAKKALISEAQYQNRTIPYTDDESFFDDEWNDTEEHFLTPSIVFLELDNANQSSGWNRDAYRLEKKLLEYCKGRDLSLNQCYTFKTDRHHLIFMSVQEEQDDWEKPYAYIMYIDIGPITRYIVTLNWAFFAVLLAISSVMCLLGFRFGRDIEKEAERQQTFFQNASHELKTPLMAIQGYAEGIQAGVMDTGSAAEVILEESDRMTELVEELLDISKIDMGRQQLALSEMDIRELLYDSIRAVEPAAAASGITIVPDFPEEPVMVSCDDTQLRRAVTNILIQRRALCPQRAAPDLPRRQAAGDDTHTGRRGRHRRSGPAAHLRPLLHGAERKIRHRPCADPGDHPPAQGNHPRPQRGHRRRFRDLHSGEQIRRSPRRL